MATVRTIHESDGTIRREVENERYSTVHGFLVEGEHSEEGPEYTYEEDGEPPQYAKEALNEFHGEEIFDLETED